VLALGWDSSLNRQHSARRTAGPEAGMQSAENGPVMLQVVPAGQHPWVVEEAGQHTASGPKWQHPYLGRRVSKCRQKGKVSLKVNTGSGTLGMGTEGCSEQAPAQHADGAVQSRTCNSGHAITVDSSTPTGCVHLVGRGPVNGSLTRCWT
jgi:hypothetical protein